MSRGRLVVGAAVAVAWWMAAAGAGAQDAAVGAAPSGLVTKPIWVKILNDRSRNMFYPDHAEKRGITGYAEIECSVNGSGGLGRCAVVAEDPKKEGFGSALLNLPRFLQIGVFDAAGQPTANRRIRLASQFGALKDEEGQYGLNLFVVGD